MKFINIQSGKIQPCLRLALMLLVLSSILSSCAVSQKQAKSDSEADAAVIAEEKIEFGRGMAGLPGGVCKVTDRQFTQNETGTVYMCVRRNRPGCDNFHAHDDTKADRKSKADALCYANQPCEAVPPGHCGGLECKGKRSTAVRAYKRYVAGHPNCANEERNRGRCQSSEEFKCACTCRVAP